MNIKNVQSCNHDKKIINSVVKYSGDEFYKIMEKEIFKQELRSETEDGFIHIYTKNWKGINSDVVFKKLGKYLNAKIIDIVAVDGRVYIIFDNGIKR